MAREKSSGPEKPDGDNSDIPLLEAIVIPGHSGPSTGAGKKKPSAKTATNSEPPAPAPPPRRSSNAPPTPPVAHPPYETAEIDQILVDLVDREVRRIAADLEPHLAEDILPRLITDVLQPEINAVYEEVKAISHGVEARIEERLASQLAVILERVESANKQSAANKSLSATIESLQNELRTLSARVDGETATQAKTKEVIAQRFELLNQQFETRIKERLASLTSVDQRIDSVVDEVRKGLNEQTAPLEALREQVTRTQRDLITLQKSAALAHRQETQLNQLRQELAELKAEQTNFLAAFDDKLEKVFLQRLSAVQKIIGGTLQKQFFDEMDDRFDKIYLRRLATLPKLVENMVRTSLRSSGTTDRVQLAPAAPAPQANIASAPVTTESTKLQEAMEKTYDPSNIETRWYDTWEKAGYFAPRGEGKPYCIMIPPPNVTGSLHMGHAFQDTIMDALTRYHRMMGDNTLWQAGTDHAGIATQMVVERQLASKGKSRHDLGREAFIKQVWQWKGESGGMITRQLRRLGASLDWSRERFTMDAGLSKAVREVFVRLYEEGLIYRGKRLVNWDPVLHTAVSDLEVISQEEDGSLWHIRYPLAGETGQALVVATTRPETLLGDCAVAIHPEDERYRHLIGRYLELPLTNRRIPIIADEYVEREFGTGCVKITPAHDFNDYQVWQRHRESAELKTVPQNGLINIFTVDAKIKSSWRDDESFAHRAPAADGSENPRAATVDLIPEQYRGLDRFVARNMIVGDLERAGLLEKIVKHKLMVPRGDRSQAVIEPYLTDQWFVRAAPLAEPAIKAVENGEIRFIPENWTNTYFEWMRNIEDWCISRQIWWGHRIPAWYDRRGNVYVGRSEAEIRKKHDLPSLVPLSQDPDVLDTWFSSALWPFSTLGWPESTPEMATFYPTNVLVTGFDIIFFWVARMIMMGLKFTGKVPFREVYIHGLVRDAEGQKMSKSKGNVLDPIDLIDGIDLEKLLAKRTSGLMQPEMAARVEKATRSQFPEGIPAFGTDALRFTFAALASTGRDVRFDTGRIEGYRNFCNKLWNATRFVLMNTEGKDLGTGHSNRTYSLADRWIQSRLQITIQAAHEAFRTYRLDLLASTIYEFTWNEYCDWYLELAKPVLHGNDIEAARGTRFTLIAVLETLLRLVHPIMPFITEEIWQKIGVLAGKQGDSIMLQAYPQADDNRMDNAALQEMGWVMEFILGIRKIRGEMNIQPGRALPLLLQGGDDNDRARFDRSQIFIKSLAKLDTVSWLQEREEAPDAATALVGNLKLLVPMAGLIDKQAELARLEKETTKLRKDLAGVENKLANTSFVDRAPTEVVAKERQRAAELRGAIRQLDEQLARIERL